MKATLFFSFLVALPFLLFTGCSADSDSDNASVADLPAVNFTAGYASNDLTRTGMDAGYNILWCPGDVVNVNGQQSLGTVVSDAGRTASFVVGASTPTYYAFYPALMVSFFDETAHTFAITLPATQSYKSEVSFSDNANPAVAISENTYLSFYNVCGMLRVPITTNVIAAKARLLSADNAVSGEATVNPSTKTLTVVINGGKTVDITSLPTTLTYTLTWVLPVGTYCSGWKIQLLDDNDNVLTQKTSSSELTIKCGYLANVTTILSFLKDETPTVDTESEVIYDYIDGGGEWSSGDIGF